MCEILNNRSFYESSAFGAIIGFVGSFLIFIISDALRNHQDKLKNKKKIPLLDKWSQSRNQSFIKSNS
ncbi:MAG: hypothetical protein WC823_04740 [Parcubacteria group bacterium]|jgi:hypothetical protein